MVPSIGAEQSRSEQRRAPPKRLTAPCVYLTGQHAGSGGLVASLRPSLCRPERLWDYSYRCVFVLIFLSCTAAEAEVKSEFRGETRERSDQHESTRNTDLGQTHRQPPCHSEFVLRFGWWLQPSEF